MVLQILADTRQGVDDADAMLAQFLRIADAGQHQDLRRVDPARRQDHFTSRTHALFHAMHIDFNASGA